MSTSEKLMDDANFALEKSQVRRHEDHSNGTQEAESKPLNGEINAVIEAILMGQLSFQEAQKREPGVDLVLQRTLGNFLYRFLANDGMSELAAQKDKRQQKRRERRQARKDKAMGKAEGKALENEEKALGPKAFETLFFQAQLFEKLGTALGITSLFQKSEEEEEKEEAENEKDDELLEKGLEDAIKEEDKKDLDPEDALKDAKEGAEDENEDAIPSSGSLENAAEEALSEGEEKEGLEGEKEELKEGEEEGSEQEKKDKASGKGKDAKEQEPKAQVAELPQKEPAPIEQLQAAEPEQDFLPAVAPEAPVPLSTGESDIDAYMVNHPDEGLSAQVSEQGTKTDYLGELSGNLADRVKKAPDKSWLDAVPFSPTWFADLDKKVGQPWIDGDKFLKGLEITDSIVGSLNTVISNISLVATVGGAILSLFFPPVGAFLLAVGRIAQGASLILDVVQVVLSLVKSVYLTVKVAKEKDPAKRLEMMHAVKESVQKGIMSGINVVMSKIGGKAKGPGSKSASSMKSTFKQSRAAGKSVAASAKTTFTQQAKQAGAALKDTFSKKNMKQQLGRVKGGAKGVMTKVKNPGATLKSTFKNSAGWKDISGGMKDLHLIRDTKVFVRDVKKMGYKQTIQYRNFPSTLGKEGFKDKMKAVYKDMTDKSAGGYATRVDRYRNGYAGDKPVGKADELRSSTHKVGDQATAYRNKLKDYNEAGGSELLQRQYLAKTRGEDLTALSHVDSKRINQMYLEQGRQLKNSMTYGRKTGTLIEKINYRGAVLVGGTGYLAGELSGSDFLKTLAVGPGINQNILGDGESVQSKYKLTGKYMLGIETDKNWAAKMEAFKLSYQPRSLNTAQFVALMAAADANAMESQLQASRSATESKAELGTGGSRGNEGLQSLIPVAPTSQREAPKPQPSPEGLVVPGEDLVLDIEGQRNSLIIVKQSVQESIAAAKAEKETAIDGNAKLREYAEGLEKQSTVIQAQETEAKLDAAELSDAKSEIQTTGGELGQQTAATESEQAKTEGYQQEGESLNTEPDEGKKKAEEEKRAKEEQAEDTRKAKESGFWGKVVNGVKRVAKAIGSFLASAAKWVWKKIIAPAIAAVKKALSAVMEMITDLMMAGIMKLVSMFLSEEENNRLNETMAELKEQEGKDAVEEVEETKAANEEARAKLDEGQGEAADKIDSCQANIDDGEALLLAIDEHDAELAATAAMIKISRETFRAQYAPYFEWLREYEAWEQEQALLAVQEGGGDAAMGALGGKSQRRPGQAPSTQMDKHFMASMYEAADMVSADSKTAHLHIVEMATVRDNTRVASLQGVRNENLGRINQAQLSQEEVDLRRAYTDSVYEDASSLSKGSSEEVIRAHQAAEEERQARIAKWKSEVGKLEGLSNQELVQKAATLWKEIMTEASGLEAAQEAAAKELQLADQRQATTASSFGRSGGGGGGGGGGAW